MKKKIKPIFDFISDIILTYSVFVMLFIALSFLVEMPIICVPLLILSLAVKVIPVIRKKKERDES